MELGIFAKTFVQTSLDANLAAVASYGLRSVQFNLSCAGLSPMPDEIHDEAVAEIKRKMVEYGIAIDALSGTFNMAHPDHSVREQGLRRLETLAAAARPMGAKTITLCTGTRNRDNMWHWHPDNDTTEAWADLVETMTAALAIADRFDVNLAIEPEPGNVIKNATVCRTFLDQLGHDRLGVIIDPANVLSTDRSRGIDAILDDACQLLAKEIVIAHAKDLGTGERPCAPGKGIVPWDRFVATMKEIGFDGPVIMHGFDEPDVAGAVAHLRPLVP